MTNRFNGRVTGVADLKGNVTKLTVKLEDGQQLHVYDGQVIDFALTMGEYDELELKTAPKTTIRGNSPSKRLRELANQRWIDLGSMGDFEEYYSDFVEALIGYFKIKMSD